jgi:hypothetical protein
MRTQPDTNALWFDYEARAWVKDGRYVRCGHPEAMNCRCYGKRHEGESAPPPEAQRRDLRMQ